MSIITDLENKIIRNSNLYYSGSPSISDAEFDRLVDQLREIDPGNMLLNTTGWGYKVPTDRKIAHPITNISGLDKVKSHPSDVINSKFITPKYDGASVELVYVNGLLVNAITRGDGVYGQDVTKHLRPIVNEDIVSRFSNNRFHELLKNSVVSISGEFILSNSSKEKNYPNEISHRNIASGFLNRSEVSEDESKRFSFIPFKINGLITNKSYVNTYVNMLSDKHCAQELLISVMETEVPYIINPHDSYSNIMDKFVKLSDYNFDGLVVSDQSNNGVEIDELDNDRVRVIFVHNEVAYKVVTESVEVEVTDISWNLTRTGRLVPRVWFEPVQLSGANITKATGHNYSYLLENKIGIGSKIEVTRSGEVIPYIIGVVEESKDLKGIITNCPECKSEIQISASDAICSNDKCSGKSYNKLYRWMSYLGSTDGAGSSIFSSMIEYGELSVVSDFYEKDIDWSNMMDLPGFGVSKMRVVDEVVRLLNSPIELSWFLVACNIRGVSSSTAKKLERDSNILECLINNDLDSLDLSNCKGVGYSTFKSISDNWDYIITNFQYVKIKSPEQINGTRTDDSRLKVAITGRLESGTKSKFYEKYIDTVVESSVPECDVLISNKTGSSKYNRAVSLGKVIMTESEFIEKYG